MIIQQKNTKTMKLIILILAFLVFSIKIMGQSATIQPELFTVPTATSLVNVCLESGKGKIFIHPSSHSFCYCFTSANYDQPLEKWEANGSDIYYLGKVGILNNFVNYDLDISGELRTPTLIVNGNVGINTNTPTEKLELKDRPINIESTADAKLWQIKNVDSGNRLEFVEFLFNASMFINYGGSIGIGNLPTTDKLKVHGDVAYAGSLSVEGKGTLANTATTQLVMQLVTSQTTTGTYTISNNTCGVVLFSFPTTFTATPALVLGQNISSLEQGANLVKTVDTVTTSGGTIRVCNNTGGGLSFSNQTFQLMAIGQ